jgi:hypothetical protein
VELYLHSLSTPSWRGAQLKHRDNFNLEREEVAGGWRRLNNEELHNLHVSSNVIRVIKWRRTRSTDRVTRAANMEKKNSILVGKSKGKRPLGRHRH